MNLKSQRTQHQNFGINYGSSTDHEQNKKDRLQVKLSTELVNNHDPIHIASHKLNEVLACNTEEKKSLKKLPSSLNIQKHSIHAFSSSYYTHFLRTIINKKNTQISLSLKF